MTVHTRSYGDWSSDVCSSDLAGLQRELGDAELEREWVALSAEGAAEERLDHPHLALRQSQHPRQLALHVMRDLGGGPDGQVPVPVDRSEERRVGKECR